MKANKIVKTGAQVGGLAAAVYVLYEGYEYVRYRFWKKKNASNPLTFSQWKATKPA